MIGCILGLNLKKLSSQSTVGPSIQVDGTGGRVCEEIGRPCFLTQLDTEVKDWLFELQDDQRLNIALKAFKAIDKQMQIGADVREVVGQVLREIRTDFSNVKDAMDNSVRDYLKDIIAQAKASKEETEKFIKQNVGDQTAHLVEKVDLLLKQGKSIEEIQKALKEDTEGFVKSLITSQMELVVDKIETLLKQEKSIEEIQKELKEDTKSFVKEIVQEQVKTLVEKVELLLKQGKTVDEIEKELKAALSGLENAQSGLNTLLQTFKVSSVKGEKGELELLTMINEAFLTDKNVLVKPLGGPDATDVMVKFCCQDLEIGEVLIESKAAQTWSNDYLEQVKADMKRYGVATAILAVQKTPRGAKVRGYTIDETLGIVVITTPEMAVSTLAMFYDMYLANYRLGRKTMNLQTIMDDKDILCHIQDNMECLNDCKKINDCVDKAHRDIHVHVSTIMNRLKENNEKIALILSKHGKTIVDESESLAQEGIAQTPLDRTLGKADKTSREWVTAGDKK
jgi:translation initiation factor 2 beta subunit (eIF-2beta)/eIF-5